MRIPGMYWLAANDAGLLGARVGLIVDLQHMLHGQLGVALRCGEAFMAQQFLNGTQVCSFFQHVGAESVAQSVRMNVWR